MARIWVLCASTSQRREVDRLFASFSLRPVWAPQPHQALSFQAVLDSAADGASIASSLAKIGTPFEIESEFERFLFHPGLGLKRQQFDDSGEVVVRIGQLREELRQSDSNAAEFERRLRLLAGQAWLDILEPYRLGILRYDQMPKAV